MKMEVSISQEVLNKIKETITIDQIDKDIPIDWRLSSIVDIYSNIINCGLRDLDGKFTWNEIYYMLASINSTAYTNTEVAFTADCFIAGLVDFEIYDKVQAEQFKINGRELAARLRKEHHISRFALLSLLHQCWVVDGYNNDFQAYIEKHLQLQA